VEENERWEEGLRGRERLMGTGRYIFERTLCLRDWMARTMDGFFGTAVKGLAGAAATLCLMAGTVEMKAQQPAETQNVPATGKLSAAPPVTYANRWEIYGGIMLQNDQAGQNLPKRMNMGGVEALGTYWITKKWGVGGDFRGMAGTTPVFPNPYTTRPLVVMYEGMGGVEYRGPKNQRAAINFHALGGVMHGNFTETPLPAGEDVGLYTNRTKPMAAVGASVDFNRSRNLAFRLSPDLIIETLGTEVREFFAISGGVVYRFGKK
jgi:hypothetical protein